MGNLHPLAPRFMEHCEKGCGKNIKSQKMGGSAVKCSSWTWQRYYTHKPTTSRLACEKTTQDQVNQNSMVNDVDGLQSSLMCCW